MRAHEVEVVIIEDARTYCQERGRNVTVIEPSRYTRQPDEDGRAVYLVERAKVVHVG